MKARSTFVATAMVTSAVAAPTLYGCFAADGLALPTKDAGALATPGDECERRRLPAPPSEPDGADDSFVFAIQRLVFENRDSAAAPIGFDLDEACSCHDGGVETCVSASPKCDAPFGIDNAGTSIAGVLPRELSLEQSMNDRIALGRGGLLVKVDGYNRLANDARVGVSFFPSRGTYDALSDGGAVHVAREDAGTRWSYDPDFELTAKISKLSAEGYVRDFVLVVAFRGKIPIAGLELELEEASFVAPIRLEPLRIEGGTIIGRWPLAGVTSSIGNFNGSTLFGDAGNGLLCSQVDLLALLKPRLCEAADIMRSKADDKTGKRCDALSVAIAFEASLATLGDPVRIDALPACPETAPIACD